MVAALLGARRARRRDTPVRLRWRDDAITAALGLWLVAGLFVDGRAHLTRPQLETFFTPWHALFYSGYAASAAWLGWLRWRAHRAGTRALPPGYALGAVGLLVFAAGGLGDLWWHMAFGIEQNRAALLSPLHLLLFLGVTLIVTSPFRAAWLADGPAADAPSLRGFLPPLLALTAATGAAAFMNGYLWGLDASDPWTERARRAVPATSPLVHDLDLAQVLATTVLLLAPLLLILRRWRPPFGSMTVLLTAVAAPMHDLTGVLLRYPERTASVLATGLIADTLVRLVRPWPNRPGAVRLFAATVPLSLWGLHFLAVYLRVGQLWRTELWAGVTVMASLSGLALSLLTVPPPTPGGPEPAADPCG